MKRYTQSAIAAALICFLAGCGPEPEKKGANGEEELVDLSFYSGGRLIPGDGSAPVEDVTFTTEKGKITAIGGKGEVRAPKGSLRVELDGRTVMPLLTNIHGHVGLNTGANFSPKNYTRDSIQADLNRYAYYGVGTVAVLGSDAGDLAFEIRDEQRAGKGTGARIYTAGRGITARNGWPAVLGDIPIQVSSEAEARKAVQDQVAKKVDFIKVWVDDNMGRVPKLSPALYKAAIDEAHKNNVRVFAHVFYLADAKDLVDAGIDGLVHSIRDREVDDALINAMKEKNVFLAPTLTAHEAKFAYADRPRWLGEQTMREVYPAQLTGYLIDDVFVNRFRRNSDLPALRQQYKIAAANLKRMSAAGVRIALGTDSGSTDTYPGYFELREMELMQAAGMPAVEVIKAATSVPAEIVGATDSGVLAVGKNADFMIVMDNPLDDLTNVKDITDIYRAGLRVNRADLIQGIKIELPRITDADRKADAAAQAKAAQDAADAKLEHFGKFPIGPSANFRSMAVPTPKYSKASVTPGPPDRITIAHRATAAELRQFYVEALPRYRWKASGNCWEREHPTSKRPQVLCAQFSANTASIQVTEK
jgi:imidazolonepropionase-like amidohydrolase